MSFGGPPCQAISSGVRLQARPMDPAPLASSRHIGEFRHDRARPFLHVIAEMRTRRCSSPCGNPTIRDGRSSRTYAPHVAQPAPACRYASTRCHRRTAAICRRHCRATWTTGRPQFCLSIVTQLKDFGLRVIAHEFGVATWPVATRCRVPVRRGSLPAGRPESRFPGSLLATLRDLLVALQELRDEESQIQSWHVRTA